MTSEPITRRQMTEALRKDRGATKRFLAVEVAPLRERIARIEKRLYMEQPTSDYLATYADEQAAAFAAGPEDPDE
jgi:hypothetical protein